MSSWHNLTINDLGQIITGSTPPTKKTEYYGNEYPFITPTDMKIDSRIVHTERFLSQTGYEYNKNRLLPPNTVCVVCIASIGKTCMTTVPSVTNQQINSIVVNQQKHDPYFVYYLLRTKTEVLHNIASGVASPIVNKSTFGNLEVYVPPLPTQRKIAAVLSAYDDLIENNTRRIKILEDMAQTLYREWFVHFRFPGHENVRMVESSLELIPQGWEIIAASEAMFINPRTSAPRDTKKPFVPMKSATENSMLITDVEEKTGNSGAKFKNGDTLFARITPCLENGRTGFVQFLPNGTEIAFGSTEFIVLRSKTLNPYFVYLLAQTHDFREHAIKSMTGATGRQRVLNQCFDDYFLPNPNQDILDQFESTVISLFRKVQNFAEKNTNLRQTRDLLLPKLISGEIDVSELDIDIDIDPKSN
ncbi:restriction endonuclease subunit S [Candidatus Poribacteria bacterium]|nr:restriction endonuclease subunit S [Candidatus Poribacteria bacterium]MYA55442.1 restriction endonuclease subunit S [Candidatus Poribacteria bacterium]